jgi:hypothetical protein
LVAIPSREVTHVPKGVLNLDDIVKVMRSKPRVSDLKLPALVAVDREFRHRANLAAYTTLEQGGLTSCEPTTDHRLKKSVLTDS